MTMPMLSLLLKAKQSVVPAISQPSFNSPSSLPDIDLLHPPIQIHSLTRDIQYPQFCKGVAFETHPQPGWESVKRLIKKVEAGGMIRTK